jgi:hypothetical protein
MKEVKDVWGVLSEIRNTVNSSPFNEQELRLGAYYFWEKHPAASNNECWFANLHSVRQDKEFWHLNIAIGDAKSRKEHEIVVGLSVVMNLAVFLRMRPSDVCRNMPFGLVFCERALVKAGVSCDLEVDFYDLGVRETVGEYIDSFWMQYSHLLRLNGRGAEADQAS